MVAASVLGAVLCVGLSLGAGRLMVQRQVLARLADPEGTVGQAALRQCAEAPERWSQVSGGIRIWAYGPDGVSRNPDAPPLLMSVPTGRAAEVQGVTRWTVFAGPQALMDRASVQRVADAGPCAVLQARTPNALPAWDAARVAGAFGLLLGVLLVGMGTTAFAVRPMLDRLREVDRAAAAVGTPRFVGGAADDDAFGRIVGTLEDAHGRILGEQLERERRHRALEDYLAGVAHDLRTPLASLQLLLESATRSDTPKRELGEARLEVAYLEGLVDTLHQASRLTSLGARAADGRSEWSGIVERVAMRFGILGRVRGVDVVTALPDAPVEVACDPALAERLLANLVHNALVHGRAGGEVIVALDREADRFTLSVSSEGPPVEPEVLERLRRRTLDPTGPSRTREGGLGVGIVNAVAALAGWRVAYHAREGGGLLVLVSGPRAGD